MAGVVVELAIVASEEVEDTSVTVHHSASSATSSIFSFMVSASL